MRSRSSRPRGRERLADGVLLLVRERMPRTSALYLLGEDARVGPAVEARDDDPVALRIEQRHREGLVTARVGERIEADDTDLLDAALRECFELVVKLVQRLDPLRDGIQTAKLAIQDLVEARALVVADETGQPPPQERV